MAKAFVDPKLLPKSNLQKAKWESSNEGVHERVNFDDTIWGFDLAGGSKYGTPLRVTKVKRNSRADKAGIRKGDKLKRINDIKTETLTLQEAHDIILESGIYIRLAVTAPEDTDTSYSCYQDEEEYWDEEEEERKRLEELQRKRRVVCKTNSDWSLMWPWVSKKTYIYKESNCYLVPSKFEEKHKDRLLPSPEPTTIALFPTESKKPENAKESSLKENKSEEKSPVNHSENSLNGNSTQEKPSEENSSKTIAEEDILTGDSITDVKSTEINGVIAENNVAENLSEIDANKENHLQLDENVEEETPSQMDVNEENATEKNLSEINAEEQNHSDIDVDEENLSQMDVDEENVTEKDFSEIDVDEENPADRKVKEENQVEENTEAHNSAEEKDPEENTPEENTPEEITPEEKTSEEKNAEENP